MPLTQTLAALADSDADPDEVRSDFLDILTRLPAARILGPDEAGGVWLTGRTVNGLPISLGLGRPGNLIADTALEWRSTRELAF